MMHNGVFPTSLPSKDPASKLAHLSWPHHAETSTPYSLNSSSSITSSNRTKITDLHNQIQIHEPLPLQPWKEKERDVKQRPGGPSLQAQGTRTCLISDLKPATCSAHRNRVPTVSKKEPEDVPVPLRYFVDLWNSFSEQQGLGQKYRH